MDQSKNYITPEGLERLRAEYSTLINGERPKVVETVTWAASNGDRSENADYQYGKKRLREIDRRLHFLQKRMEAAEVIDPKSLKSERIIFGATVTFENEDGAEKIYQIVGEDEFNINLGKISWKSPMAKALLGRSKGDEIEIVRPAGMLIAQIRKVVFE